MASAAGQLPVEFPGQFHPRPALNEQGMLAGAEMGQVAREMGQGDPPDIVESEGSNAQDKKVPEGDLPSQVAEVRASSQGGLESVAAELRGGSQSLSEARAGPHRRRRSMIEDPAGEQESPQGLALREVPVQEVEEGHGPSRRRAAVSRDLRGGNRIWGRFVGVEAIVVNER